MSKGVYVVSSAGYDIKKRSNAVDDANLVVIKGIHAFDGGNIGAMKATTYFIILETTQFLQPLDIEIQRTHPDPLFDLLLLLRKRYASSIYNSDLYMYI